MTAIELTAEKMVFEGKALARDQRFVYFIEGALPGERVRAAIYRRKKQFAEGRVEQVLAPAPFRVTPDCPLFGNCGGCTFRHCAYPDQLRLKQEVLAESLFQVPGAAGCLEPIVGMADPQYYRNKMTFTFGVAGGRVVAGLHPRGNFREILLTNVCRLQSPESNAVLDRVLEFVNARRVPVFDDRTGQGRLRNLVIREGKHTGQRMVQVITLGVAPELADLPAALGPLCDTLLVGIDAHPNGPAFPHEWRVLSGVGSIEERLNGLVFPIGPDTFFQTNTLQAEQLFQYVATLAGATRPNIALDLYSGVGTIAMHLDGIAGMVVGMESNPESVKIAEENIRRNHLDHIRLVCAAVENAGEQMLPGSADLVVVDPPRPGLHRRALDRICAIAPPRIIYVSCNPATLARDLNLFTTAGFRLVSVRPFDMFPHTFHVEAVALLERNR